MHADAFHSLINSILVISIIYALAVLLRRRGILLEEHSMVLARVVTDLCLPAMIFVTLAKLSIRLDQVGPAMVTLGLGLFCMALAWAVSVLLKFNRSQQGAIVFCSVFGSSTFLGYSVILQMFPQTPEAIGEAVLISEFGVGYPIFILGPILAAHFGLKASDLHIQWKASLGFFRSTVFFALLLGLFWGHLHLPGEENLYLAPLFQLGDVLGSALTPLAVLSVGLMFKLPRFRVILLPLAIVVLIKLIIQPLLAGFVATQFGFPDLWRAVLVLLTAMPPAVLGVVFLKRYGGDASLASALLLVATLLSCATLVFVFWVNG